MIDDICRSQRYVKKNGSMRQAYYRRQNALKRPLIFVYSYRGIYRVEVDVDSAYPLHYAKGDVETLLRLAHEHWDTVKARKDTLLFAGGGHYLYFSRFTEDVALKVAAKAVELWDTTHAPEITSTVQ